MRGAESILEWMPLLSGTVLKSLIVFALAGAALFALRRASASARHLVCLLTLAALLALPCLSWMLPGWRLPILAVPTASSASKREAVPSSRLSSSRLPSSRLSAALPLAPSASLPHAALPPLDADGTSSSAPSRSIPWAILLAALWLLGCVVVLLRPLLGLWGIAGLSRDSAPVTETAVLVLAAECASALGLTRKPLLRQADAPVPMTWGWRHPVILLPAEAENWPTYRLQAVLLHEMAHIRRCDWLTHRFVDGVCALYWFHPFVWLIARRLRAESEIACDDLVLTSGIAAPDYARHLLNVARALRPLSVVIPQTAIAMARTTQIEGRLKMILDNTRSRRALTRRILVLSLTPGAVILIGLAMLRPSAKAQAVSAPSVKHIAAPVRVAQLPKAALPVAPVVPNSTDLKAPPADFRDNGVLLAGMTNGTDLGSHWWAENGALLPQDIYDTKVYQAESHAFSPSTKNVIFAFSLSPTNKSATVRYEVPDSLGASSMGSWPFKLQSQAHLTEAQFDIRTGGTRILTAAFPNTLSHTTFRVGVASGPWKTLATDTLSGPDGYGSTDIKEGNSKLLFGPALETKTDVVLTISTDTTDDLRVVAVDAQGRESLPTQIGDTGYSTLDQITAHFAQPLAKIKEIRVQTRPFRWVEFKNVALQPSK